ncbi:succinyl-diaminopimelate desuccinylase [Helicobacter himalayensis]|uniref:succinyl-diaminopimelate desuccinylase n=1 Tax=Helicobacter himalayensis TaxID=1591088 RepID=UPI003D6EA928
MMSHLVSKPDCKFDCISLLQKLITYPSITPKECGIYELIKNLLSKNFDFLEQESGDVKNLFAYSKNFWDFAESKPPHICFAGHIDVVPPGEGWEYEPFAGVKSNGIVYGRGAQDMKGGVSAFICAILEFLERNKDAQKHLRISLLLTSDEEGEGTYGTQYMLPLLAEKGLMPDMVVVAEPSASETSGDSIKIGRRGSINGVLKIFGKQGHVAYPAQCVNPVELLGARLGKLAGVNLDNGDGDFEPSKLVITDIRGGLEVTNVTPNEVKILFNVRNSPQTSLERVESYVREVCEGLEFDLQLRQSSLPFLTQRGNPLISRMQKSIQKVCGKEALLSTAGGTSDARFFGARAISVVEVGVPNDTIHAVNERVKISDVRILQEIFLKFLEDFVGYTCK